jgi:hypothetical protein
LAEGAKEAEPVEWYLIHINISMNTFKMRIILYDSYICKSENDLTTKLEY